jgi:hypothetical protein
MNIDALLKHNKREAKWLRGIALDAAGLAYGRSFWIPILSRWLVWFGCSWAVGSVLVFAPLISKAVKALFQ